MSVNYSFSTNESLPSPLSSSFTQHGHFCLYSITSERAAIALAFANILLLLPLSIFVLNLGFQRWRSNHSASSPAATSFSDVFTYNMAALELIGVLGYIISICSYYTKLPVMFWVGILVRSFPWSGQMFFPILACVEHYLAVVHPITYLRLRQTSGVRIRNISSGVVWLNCFAEGGFLLLNSRFPRYSLIIYGSLMAFLLIAVTFFSLSVLCVLIRPRPGEAGGKKVRVGKSKRKAFHTILIIMGVLVFRFGGNLVCDLVALFLSIASYRSGCLVTAATDWFNLPSSLVLPLLLLHREGKLPGCKRSTQLKDKS